MGVLSSQIEVWTNYLLLLGLIDYRDLGFHQQALYCYRKLCTLDPSNTAALWERATLAKEIG